MQFMRFYCMLIGNVYGNQKLADNKDLKHSVTGLLKFPISINLKSKSDRQLSLNFHVTCVLAYVKIAIIRIHSVIGHCVIEWRRC